MQLLALDFDGVLCDGLLEYFQTAWQAYRQLWQAPFEPPLELAEQFYALRPVVETGWEMPLLLHALIQGIDPAQILEDWHGLAKKLLQQENLDPKFLAHTLDSVRDSWIERDLPSWLLLHRFYPGVLDRLQQLQATDLLVFIISTKESRFIRQLLTQGGVDFPSENIYGKEIKQPKYLTLHNLQQHYQLVPSAMTFVEDRYLTLLQVQERLPGVQLFLADWGYNTLQERARVIPPLKLLTLEQFKTFGPQKL